MNAIERTAYQILEDALAKHRVVKGIELLQEKFPNGEWVDKIDEEWLDLSSVSACVLGQVFGGSPVTESEAEAWQQSNRGRAMLPGYTLEEAVEYLNSTDGFERGLAILDGALLHDKEFVAQYGFDKGYAYFPDLLDSTDDELSALGVTREQVEAAEAEQREYLPGVALNYDTLDEVWKAKIDEIRANR